MRPRVEFDRTPFTDRLFAVTSPRVVMLDLLAGREVKRGGVTNCVNPGHEDTNASMSVDLDKGVFKCFACSAHGGVLDLAVLRGNGRDRGEAAAWLGEKYRVPGNAAPRGGESSPSPTAAAPKEQASGPAAPRDSGSWPWFPETAVRLGWEPCVARDGRPGLRVPTYAADGTEGRAKRRYKKRDDGRFTGEFEGEKGEGVCGLENRPALDKVRGNAKPRCALLAGETDLLAWTHFAHREGIDVPGVSHSHGEGTSLGELAAAFAGFHVTVIYDNDDAGKKGSVKIIEELRGVAASIVSIVVPDPHKDVCDFLRAGGTVRELLAIAEKAAAPAAKSREWPELVPLGHCARPVFPVGTLPRCLGAWSGAVAGALQVPIDVPCMLGLAAMASVVARKFEARPRKGWSEPLNLYCIIALPPGSRKSPAVKAAIGVIQDFEEEEKKRTAQSRARQAADYEMLEKRAAAANLDRINARKEDDARDAQRRFDKANEELDACPEPRAEPRLVGDDITPEELVAMLSRQRERFALFSAEGGLLKTVAGTRYSKTGTPSYDTLLKAHSGDTIAHDRKHGDPIRVKRPALTLGICVQPEILRQLAEAPGAAQVGLLARFLYSVPEDNVGHRAIRPEPALDEITWEYRAAIRKLLEIEVPDDPTQVEFSDYADEALTAFEAEVEPRLRPDGDLADMRDWAAKLVGLVARIATILYLTDVVASGDSVELVETQYVTGAIEIGRYLLLHARAALTEAQTFPEVALAKRIMAWVERKSLTGFSARDAFLAMKGTGNTIQKVSQIRPGLQELVETGHVRLVPSGVEEGPGRRQSDFYEVRQDLQTCGT